VNGPDPAVERRAPGQRTSARRGFRLAAALSAAALAPAALLSCGGEPPELRAVEWRLELRPAEGGAYESLSVFANIRDSDGIEDIEALWLVADGAELSWTIDDAKWLRRDEGGETWMGAAGLAMGDYGSLPRGDYRLVAADLAGRRAERRFTLEATGALPPLPSCRYEAPPAPKAQAAAAQGKTAAPAASATAGTAAAAAGTAAAAAAAAGTAQAGTAVIDSAWPETLLPAYDGAGALVKAAAARHGRNDLAAVLGAAEAGKAAALASYGYDPARRIGAYSWKTRTR